jgi:hypothetical protein
VQRNSSLDYWHPWAVQNPDSHTEYLRRKRGCEQRKRNYVDNYRSPKRCKKRRFVRFMAEDLLRDDGARPAASNAKKQ